MCLAKIQAWTIHIHKVRTSQIRCVILDFKFKFMDISLNSFYCERMRGVEGRHKTKINVLSCGWLRQA